MGLETVRIRLNFSKVLIKQPVIFKMAAIFKVSPSILKADVEEEGWVLLDLTGTVEEIEHALKWLTDKGVDVKSVRTVDAQKEGAEVS
jgi:ABC-type methionine transport system ATPase subunit|tara:strand:- start:101 stop:364 length:264 start_codon:yes stop_codon:yes gene_type:complete